MYTLREFRAKTKQAFDDAEQGHEVIITRGSQKFQLISLVKDPLLGHSFESIPGSKPSKIKFVLCEHGAGVRFCKVKSCKNYQFK